MERRSRRRAAWGRRLRPPRPGAVVAVLGPDGAGKGTVIDGIRARTHAPVTVLYLGRRRSGRGGTGAARAAGAVDSCRPAGTRRVGAVRECAFLVVRAGRHLRLLAGGYAAAWRGHLVLCDRHPVEVLAIVPPRTPAGARLERFIASRMVPWPDAVILLDAPPELLFGRKAEHSVEKLGRWRQAYLDVFGPRGAAVVRTDADPEESVDRAMVAVRAATRA